MTIMMNNYVRNYGTVSYGDADGPLGALGVYEFPPNYSLSFTAKTVYAESGTVAKYVRNELTITWILPWDYTNLRPAPASTPEGNPSPRSIDTAVQQIRAILMQPRKTLTCTYQGLGPSANPTFYGFVIDSGNDVNQGPEPLDFKWRNLATQRCAEITWVVAFYTQSQIVFDAGNLHRAPTTDFLELTWNRSFDIDEVGVVTITTTGRIEVDIGANSVFDHVDQARFAAAFPVPLYCQRVSQRFQHEPNNRATRFTIVDKQFPIENAMPPGCIKMDMSHEVSSALFGGKMEGKGFLSWNNVIQANITLPSGTKPSLAYFLFLFYARQRICRVRTGGVGDNVQIPTKQEKADAAGKSADKTEKARNVVTRVSYKENIFDRTHSFRLEYLGIYNRDRLLQQSGLFAPMFNYRQDAGAPKPWFDYSKSDAEPWSSSFNHNPVDMNFIHTQWENYRNYIANGNPNWNVTNGSWSIYGYTKMLEGTLKPYIFIPEDRVNANTGVNNIGYQNALYYADAPNANAQGVDEAAANLEPAYTDLDPAESYIAYEAECSFVEKHNTFQYTRQKYDDSIKYSLQSYYGQSTPPGKENTKFTFNNPGTSQLPSDSDYTSSYNAQSNMAVVLSGYAVRVGYPPTIPSVLSYGQNPVIRAGQAMYSMKQVARGPLPIYLARWSIPYYVNTSVHKNVFENLNVNGYSGDLT